MKGIKTKFSFSKLFYNDKFVMVFSILVAFIIWFMVSTTTQETTVFTVTDIPITLPELGNDLQFFNTENMTAEVKISGNAIVVAGVTSSDVYITASDTSEVTSPGKYKLNLVPKKTGVKTDYSFESTVSPSTIEVYVDRYVEKEINITDKIVVDSVAEGKYASTTTLAQQTIKVTGAESFVNSISEAAAEYTFDNPLSETTTIDARIALYDVGGNEISQEYVHTDKTTVSATIPILNIKTVQIVPTIINSPDSFVFDSNHVIVEPSEISIAVPDDAEGITDTISTDPIDLSTVNSGNNKFTVNLNIPSGCRNLNQVTSADVTFDSTKLSSKKITLSSFTVINEAVDRKATVSTKSIDIILIGAKDQISSISAANLTAVVDMSSKGNFTGFAEMPVTISINSKFPFCWSYGTYQVDVSVVDTTIVSEPESSAEPASQEDSAA